MTLRRPTGMDVRRGVAVVAAVVALAGLGACGSDALQLVATVSGVVEVGPTCPVETLDSPCPPAPAVGVTVEVSQQGEVVASTTTDDDGRFEIAAPEGVVEVRARSTEGLPSEDVEVVTLDLGDDVEVELTLDTGIR